jgi:hypothetical protein
VPQHFCRAFYFGLTANATFTVHIEIRLMAKKKNTRQRKYLPCVSNKTHSKENLCHASQKIRTAKRVSRAQLLRETACKE